MRVLQAEQAKNVDLILDETPGREW
jgi:hypothetical protein